VCEYIFAASMRGMAKPNKAVRKQRGQVACSSCNNGSQDQRPIDPLQPEFESMGSRPIPGREVAKRPQNEHTKGQASIPSMVTWDHPYEGRHNRPWEAKLSRDAGTESHQEIGHKDQGIDHNGPVVSRAWLEEIHDREPYVLVDRERNVEEHKA